MEKCCLSPPGIDTLKGERGLMGVIVVIGGIAGADEATDEAGVNDLVTDGAVRAGMEILEVLTLGGKGSKKGFLFTDKTERGLSTWYPYPVG